MTEKLKLFLNNMSTHLKLMFSFILRQRRLKISLHGFQICRVKSCRQNFDNANMLWFTSSSVEQDGNFLGLKEAILQP